MKKRHARPRPARRRAVRAFVLSFAVTATVLAGIAVGMVADVRTRRVCDGDRATGIYTRLAEAICPSFPDEPALPDAPKPLEWDPTPYPIRFLRAFVTALPSAATRPDAMAVMASPHEN